ncbi:unnamed protein product [Lathyrus sativus]|nr:unnamed protein product [Lathyrus sativus]
MSISINGAQVGYFNCNRGVRQGDPLSPLLFCLVEDILSRGISNLVEQGSLNLIKGPRGSLVPSHVLYADDIMLFCKAKPYNMEALKSLFLKYAQCSCQHVNPHKFIIYAGSTTSSRFTLLAQTLGFKEGQLLFSYLGISIFRGKPKAVYFQPLVDRVKAKLSNWKASLLSMAGRVQTIKSVIHELEDFLPKMTGILNQVHIPLVPRSDELRWMHSLEGTLSLKYAYNFKSPPRNNIDWAKLIWNSSVPPSKSLFVWKLIPSKVPVDEALANRAILLFPSVCNLCDCHIETNEHLF